MSEKPGGDQPLTACSGPSRCPRCSGDFRCGAMDETPCWCTGLTLTAALLAELRGKYSSCLCPACLKALVATASS